MCQIPHSYSHSFLLSRGYWSAKHMVSTVCLVVLGASSAVKAIQKHHHF